MSNKKKNNFYSSEMISIDDLCYTLDDDLRNMQDSLRKERATAEREGFDPHQTEIALCYVQRELGIRDDRRAAYFEYVKKHGLTDLDLRQRETHQNNEVLN